MNDDVADDREMEVVSVVEVNQHVAQMILREKAGSRMCALHCDLSTAVGISEVRTGRIPTQMHAQELVRRIIQETRTRLTGILLMKGNGNYAWGRLFLRRATLDALLRGPFFPKKNPSSALRLRKGTAGNESPGLVRIGT